MELQFPLDASVDSSSWEKKVHPDYLFWHNNQVPYKGILRNEGHLSFEVGEQGLIIGSRVLRQDGSRILLDGKPIIEYAANSPFATDPAVADYDAAHCQYYSKKIHAVRVAGTSATWYELEIDDEGRLHETETGTATVGDVRGIRSVRIIENAERELLLIGDTQFAINNTVYNIAMAHQQVKACKAGDFYYITVVGQGTRRMPDNLRHDDLVDQTYTPDGIRLTQMGSPLNANMRVSDDGASLIPTPFSDGLPADTVYSQTFHPLEPFTITRNGQDEENVAYRWMAVSASRFLQTDGTRPTTDHNRSGDGLTSGHCSIQAEL